MLSHALFYSIEYSLHDMDFESLNIKLAQLFTGEESTSNTYISGCKQPKKGKVAGLNAHNESIRSYEV